MGGGGRGFRSLQLWCVVFFLAFTVVCSARPVVVTLPGNDGVLPAERRVLKGSVRTDDYGDPTANPGHNPKTGSGASGGKKA